MPDRVTPVRSAKMVVRLPTKMARWPLNDKASFCHFLGLFIAMFACWKCLRVSLFSGENSVQTVGFFLCTTPVITTYQPRLFSYFLSLLEICDNVRKRQLSKVNALTCELFIFLKQLSFLPALWFHHTLRQNYETRCSDPDNWETNSDKTKKTWDQKSVNKNDSHFNLCFVGSWLW